jgi:hypothetical protein
MIVFTGEQGIATYRAIAIKHGLKLYAKTGLKPNRDWTLSAMLRAAGKITDKTYKPKQILQAIADLEAWIKANGVTE